MNKQDALARLDAIEREQAELRKIINEPEYEWPDGTAGWFWDAECLDGKVAGRLKNRESDGFTDYQCVDCDGLIRWGFDNFEPLTEAILPPMIKHDGGEYKGSPHDKLLVHLRSGRVVHTFANEFGAFWTDGNIIGWQMIKRAK